MVDAFFRRLNGDARINTLFRNVDHDDLRRLVIEWIPADCEFCHVTIFATEE